MPTHGQLAVLLIAVVLFAIGGGVSLSRLWGDHRALRLAARICLWGGMLVSGGVLIWHSLGRYQSTGRWLPLEDNFDTFIWLGLLLAIFVAYVQGRRPLAGLDWFLMPVVILLLLGAAVFGSTQPNLYLPTTWSVVHRISSYGGAVAFAVAAAGGALYLMANRRLRRKALMPGTGLASLERLEHLTFVSVTLGFALLSLGLITGAMRIIHEGTHARLGLGSPKVFLTLAVWVVYALVLHSPINPRFRGRRTAMLSIFGFVLMVGTLIAVQFVHREMR